MGDSLSYFDNLLFEIRVKVTKLSLIISLSKRCPIFTRFSRFVYLFRDLKHAALKTMIFSPSKNLKRQMKLPIIQEDDILKLADLIFQWLDRSIIRVTSKLATKVSVYKKNILNLCRK